MTNRAEIRFRAKTIVTSLPRDIYSELHNKVKSNCNPCVIIVLQYRSICLSKRDSKREGLSIKIMDRATLSSKWITKRYSSSWPINSCCMGRFIRSGENTQQSSYREAPPRDPTPHLFIYHFYIPRKSTHFVYLPSTNGTPFTYLLKNIAYLLTTVNVLFPPNPSIYFN